MKAERLDIEIWYGEQLDFIAPGRAQDCINVLGRIRGSVSATVCTYQLNNKEPRPFAIGANWTRLAQRGDFNIEIPFGALQHGPNEILIKATDASGKQSVRKLIITHENNRALQPPLHIDWSALDSPYQAGQPIDGKWQIEDGQLRCPSPGYDRLFAIGDTSWSSYVITVPITVHRFDPVGFRYPSWGPGVGIMTGWQGHYPRVSEDRMMGDELRSDWWPFGAIGWYRWRWRRFGYRAHIIGNRAAVLGEAGKTISLQRGRPYMFQMRVTACDGTPNQYALRIWPQGEPQPGDWDVVCDGCEDEQSKGSAVLLAHHADASFGNVIIEPYSGSAGKN